MQAQTTIVPTLPQKIDLYLKRHATYFTATLSLFVGGTGVMMFYRFYKNSVSVMHEWLGLAFVVAIVFHMVRNRRPFTALFSQTRLYVLLAIAALIATAFVVQAPPPKSNINPGRSITQAVLRAPLSLIAPVFKMSSEQAIVKLVAAGAVDPRPEQSIEAIAAADHVDAMKLIAALSLGDKAK